MDAAKRQRYDKISEELTELVAGIIFRGLHIVQRA